MSEISDFGGLPTIPIPTGYIPVIGGDGERYLLPQFLVDVRQGQIDIASHAVKHASCGTNRVKVHTSVCHPAKRAAHHLTFQHGSAESKPFLEIAGGDVLIPASPEITPEESIALHSEIAALQKQYGITFKDAAHRLFLAEVSGIKVHFDAMQGFAGTITRIQNSVVNGFANPILHIDQTPAHMLHQTSGETIVIADEASE